MPGFPVRVSADAIGPKMKDQGGVRSEQIDVSARRKDLERWQIAGLSQASCRAWAMLKLNGAAHPTVEAHGNCWGSTTPPGATRSAQGIFVVTWPLTVPDEKDQLVPIDLKGVTLGIRKGSVRVFSKEWTITTGNVVTVELRNAADALIDVAGDGGLMVAAW